MKYKVTIEETFRKDKEVEAITPEGALAIVKDLYDDGEIRLDDTDFQEVVFGVDAPGPTEEFPLEQVSIGDIDCPVCGQTLIPLEPYDEDNVRDYWCDKCNIDIHITINEKETD